MNVKSLLRLAFGMVFGVILSTPASATSSYNYRPDEYAVVVDGRSPNGKYAVATHGEGELGDENFHVYLLGASSTKPIGPLEEITDFLDTGANAYYARWSKNSRQVSVSYRVDRHVVVNVSYRIGHARAYLLQKPTPIKRLPR